MSRREPASPVRFFEEVPGIRETLAGYSYIDGDDAGQPPPHRIARVSLPAEQFVEVESSDVPPTRDELRALCDRYRTADAIRAALAARRGLVRLDLIRRSRSRPHDR